MHNRCHPEIPQAVEVDPGEALRLETEDGIAGLLTRESVHADAGQMDLGVAHPLAGPVFVRGAEPGDLLEVELAGYETADFGVTAVIPGFGFLADLFPDPYVVKWEIVDGVARSDELPGVAVRGDPFAGVIGVAPSRATLARYRGREEALRARGELVAPEAPESAVPLSAASGLRTIPPRELGGNLDIRGLVAGSRI